jgi:hypothetical protein
LAGPPSRTAFCTGLTALYQHAALVPDATNLRVQQQIVADFVGFEPSVVAAAPAEIAPAAKLYLGRVAGVLAALNRVSLNAAKLQPGALIPYLFDPTVKAAGTKVVAFAATDCHYTIGG